MSKLTDIFLDCRYLYLRGIGELDDGTLRLVLLEATEGGAVDSAKLGFDSPPELTDILRTNVQIYMAHLPMDIDSDLLTEIFNCFTLAIKQG